MYMEESRKLCKGMEIRLFLMALTALCAYALIPANKKNRVPLGWTIHSKYDSNACNMNCV